MPLLVCTDTDVSAFSGVSNLSALELKRNGQLVSGCRAEPRASNGIGGHTNRQIDANCPLS